MKRSLRVALVTGMVFLSLCGSQPAAADIGTGYRKGVVVQEGPRKPRVPRRPAVRGIGVRSAPQVREKAAGRIVRPVAKKVAPAATGGGWGCGGDLPPCWVLKRENPNRDAKAWNGGCHAPVGYTGGPPCRRGRSTASGKWQFIRSTWGKFGGYLNAADAPLSVQDAKARALWAGGRGCSHWSAC